MSFTANEMINFEEFIVEKKVEGLYKFKRILMTLAYIFIPLIFIIFLCAVSLAAVALLIFVPLFYAWAFRKFVIPLTWRYVNIQYEYVIRSGDLVVNTLYISAAKKRVQMFKQQISQMDAIAPYNGEYRAAADDPSIEKANRHIACAFLDHPDNYYCTWKDRDGKKHVCIFQATNNAVNIMKFHNRNTVVTEVQKISVVAE